MNRQSCLNILGLNVNATEDDIKKKYKEIALKNHPDKQSEADEEKDDVFRKATDAYQKLMSNNFSPFDDLPFTASDFGMDDDQVNSYMNMFSGMASKLFENYTNDFSPMLSTTVTVSFFDILQKRKLEKEISIYGISVPIKVDCSEFPSQIIKRSLNGIRSQIMIKFEIEDDDQYSHVIKKDGRVDLIYEIGISHFQFYKGIEYSFDHIDGQEVTVKTKPISDKCIRVKNRGLNGGDLLVKIQVINPNRSLIKNISNDEYKTLLEILKKLK